MGEQLTILGSECPIVANHGPLHGAMERALGRVVAPNAPNTQRAYRQVVRKWIEHCNAVHVRAAPIEPTHLIAYLESLNLAPNTVRLTLAALVEFDVETRLELGEKRVVSLRKHVVVQRWLRSWGRDNAKAPRRQAAALTRSEYLRILHHMNERGWRCSRQAHSVLATRDRALFVFGVLGAFRGQELSDLNREDVKISDRGVQILLRRSKTDQHGDSRLKTLWRQRAEITCPIAAWRAWDSLRGGGATGPAFAAIERDGTITHNRLGVYGVRRAIARRARAAGVVISSHSLRATFVTLAREAGHDLGELAEQGAWTSTDTVRRYVRTIDGWDRNPTKGLFDGLEE